MGGSRPDLVDIHVGRVLRLRRLALRQSQGSLAAALGVSFQQVQKYERGANRVSASMLYAAAKAQGVQPGYYFEGSPEFQNADETDPGQAVQAWLASKEAWTFGEVLLQRPKAIRAAVLQFLRDAHKR